MFHTGLLGDFHFCKVRSRLRWPSTTHEMDPPPNGISEAKAWIIAQVWIMETERCVNKCPVLSLSECVNKPCVVRGGHTDLFGEEGHDGEDDERHKDAVRPELQLVSIHSPGKKKKTHFSYLSFIIPSNTSRYRCRNKMQWQLSGLWVAATLAMLILNVTDLRKWRCLKWCRNNGKNLFPTVKNYLSGKSDQCIV